MEKKVELVTRRVDEIYHEILDWKKIKSLKHSADIKLNRAKSDIESFSILDAF